MTEKRTSLEYDLGLVKSLVSSGRVSLTKKGTSWLRNHGYSPRKAIEFVLSLDENEYARHANFYHYPPELLQAIEKATAEVKRLMAEGAFPFVKEDIEALYSLFLERNKPFRKPGSNHEKPFR